MDEDYVQAALTILYEVGVKLGHTLWRITSPSHIERSGEMLTDGILALLEREEWSLAKIIGEFAVNMPSPASEIQRRLSRINYAQALKWSGDQSGALEILAAVDWTGSIRDLRLGVAVLRGEYDNAAALMRAIGRQGEIVRESGYREWPVFREFRKTKQFTDAFKDVYGKPFDSSDKNIAAATPSPNSLVVQLDNQPQLPDPPNSIGESQMPSQAPPDPPPETGGGNVVGS